jgi:predicted alpha/beta-hydrolase family hydrolase
MAEFDGWLLFGLYWGALALALFAFVDALIRPANGYVASGKLTKPAWAAITGIAAVALYLRGPMDIFGLPAVVAAIVYLVDVRPAVGGARRGNGW